MEIDVARCVLLGELADFLRRLVTAVVMVQREVAAVGRERQQRNLVLNEFETLLQQLHVANDFRTQGTGGMREDRGTKAGMKFFRDRGATNQVATLEDERLESSSGEVKGRDQAVVAAADDDDVV